MSERDDVRIKLADSLAKAIETGTTFDRQALVVPSLEDAYAIQADVRHRRGSSGSPAGYKFSLRDGGKLYGAPLLFVSDGENARHEPGIKVEIELAMVLGRDLPPRDAEYTREEVLDAVERVAVGVELVRSRYIDGPGDALPLLIADVMSNVGYILGPDLDRSVLDKGADLGSLNLTNDGTVLFEGAAKHPDGDPLAAVVVCANRGLPTHGNGFLKKGVVVTTGTLSGAPVIPRASSFSASFGGREITVSLD